MSDEGKPEDTENKEPWLAFGEQREDTFIKEVAPRLGLSARKNPEKETDPTAIDLIVDGKPTDLKTQETPFFTAEKKYDLPPQYVVTFNENDYYRYKEKNSLDVIFWVRWHETVKGWGASVEPMEGVWRVSFEHIEADIDEREVPLHQYKRRKGDLKNANASYLLNLRTMDCLARFTGPCE